MNDRDFHAGAGENGQRNSGGNAASRMPPLSFFSIIMESCILIRRHRRRLCTVGAVPWLITALTAWYLVGLWKGLMPMPDSPTSGGILLLIPMIAWGIVLTFLFAQTSLLCAVSAAYTGRKICVGRSLLFGLTAMRTVAPTSFAFVFLVLLLGCGIGWIPGLLLDVIIGDLLNSGLWDHWRSYVAPPLTVLIIGVLSARIMLFDKVAAIENLDSFAAFARSEQLLRGKAEGPWPKRYDVRMLLLLALWIITSVAAFLLFEKLFQIGAELLKPGPADFLTDWAGMPALVGSLVVSLFGSVAVSLFYFDLRFRKDGFDPVSICARPAAPCPGART